LQWELSLLLGTTLNDLIEKQNKFVVSKWCTIQITAQQRKEIWGEILQLFKKEFFIKKFAEFHPEIS
jgi:hypothetical protein